MRAMSTIIHYNGSHRAGEEPDTLEVLLARLRELPLDPRLGEFGIDMQPGNKPQGWACFVGDFTPKPAPFLVETNEPETIATLLQAMTRNLASDGYERALREARHAWLSSVRN